ncbi:uncharacterized protein ARMOST_02873 [Armillaria ostoyae]|uniref:Uncharacterized protein n=1 Tax=Armillaria ostoyae TaxID=47428 RepID=A0A284QSW8_ARMOS|nr:uncharacterized protein ARMOST_02873 [Armillaria ostoyae]
MPAVILLRTPSRGLTSICQLQLQETRDIGGNVWSRTVNVCRKGSLVPIRRSDILILANARNDRTGPREAELKKGKRGYHYYVWCI